MAFDTVIRDNVSGTPQKVDSTSQAARSTIYDTTGKEWNYEVQIGDGSGRDAFGRLRTSMPYISFESGFLGGINTSVWETGGTNASNAVPGDGSTNLSVTTTASGNWSWIQSYVWPRYAPGESRQYHFTFNFNNLVTGVRSRVGCYSDNGAGNGDGVYLEADGDAISIVLRRYDGSTTTEIRVLQVNWSEDKLDGTGKSGLNINWTLSQHLVVDYAWLGVARVRVGFVLEDGQITWAHNFAMANTVSRPWCSIGSLPLRYEVRHTALVGTVGQLKVINCCCLDEGFNDRRYVYRSSTSGTTAKATAATLGSTIPLMSLRLKTTNNATKRGVVVPTNITIAQTAATASRWFLVVGPTTLTGATFANTTDSDLVDVDTVATATAGGIVIASGFVGTGAGAITFDLEADRDNIVRACQNAAGTLTTTGRHIITLVLQTYSATAASGFGSITWKELM